MQDLQAIWNNLQQAIVFYGTQIIAAILILLAGLWAAKTSRHIFNHMMERRRVDATVRIFLSRLLYLSIITFVVIAALAKLGIQTASIVAIIGALGLAVGLALRNSLSDFAAGILLIIFRPFKAGDTIDLIGVSGTVEEINLLYTRLKSSDGKAVIVPNGKLMSNNMINLSTYKTRRAEIIVGISYDNSVEQAKAIIEDILRADTRVHAHPSSVIAVYKLTDSAVQLIIRFWANGSELDATTWSVNEAIKAQFAQAKIIIPTQSQQIIVNAK
jgi:small conductance mechanosensitive channel